LNPSLALMNDSADGLFPAQGSSGSNCSPVEMATCPACNPNTGAIYNLSPTDPLCLGRVFGQPLIEGQNLFFTTSTGTLTGMGGALDQQKGDGRIAELGAANCTPGSGQGCGICAANPSETDVQVGVGKVASGLGASAPANGNTGTVNIYSASTTGRAGKPTVTVSQPAAIVGQRLLLQQWWLRRERRSCGNPGTPNCP